MKIVAIHRMSTPPKLRELPKYIKLFVSVVSHKSVGMFKRELCFELAEQQLHFPA